jgi:hypothetical protein
VVVKDHGAGRRRRFERPEWRPRRRRAAWWGSGSSGCLATVETRIENRVHPVAKLGDLDAHARATFRALLGDRRMRVGPHPERGFLVESLQVLGVRDGASNRHERTW